jgi:hypothetical protein
MISCDVKPYSCAPRIRYLCSIGFGMKFWQTLEMICTQCGNGAEVVMNVVDGSKRCFRCHAGPDCMMLRHVQVEFKDGRKEDRLVWALNNKQAFLVIGWTRDIYCMLARPLPN